MAVPSGACPDTAGHGALLGRLDDLVGNDPFELFVYVRLHVGFRPPDVAPVDQQLGGDPLDLVVLQRRQPAGGASIGFDAVQPPA